MFEWEKIDESTATLTFQSKAQRKAIEKIILASRLLHSLKPNVNGIWTQTDTPRVNASIKGFTKNIKWQTVDELTLKLNSIIDPLTEHAIEQLKVSIAGFLLRSNPNDMFSRPLYSFEIINHDEETVYPYSFSGRGREIMALCVLWDKQPHPRNDLEVNFQEKRTYGDPSKTVDELRNQGFPRETDRSDNGTYISVTRSHSYNGQQEHYQLLRCDQSLDDMVGRSQIPPRYKRALFEHDNHTCGVCGNVYEAAYLAPDHRVPSIVEHDHLSPSNYLTKLQTLCVRCNQVKREACKKCPYARDCQNCEWAYPETAGLSIDSIKRLRHISSQKNMTINQLLDVHLFSQEP